MKAKVQEVLQNADNQLQKIDWKRVEIVFISVFVWGILAHGYMMFNKFSWGDDVTQMFFFGTTYELGRWMLEYLRRIFIFFFEANCSQPFVNGIGSFACIALSTWMMSDLFNVKRKASLIALSGAMVVTPTVLGIFIFMMTSFAYMIGLLICVTGVWFACSKKKNIFRFFISAFLICCSIGVYQAWLPMAMSIFVLYFWVLVYQEEKIAGWKAYFLTGLYYAGICVASLILYLGINQYILDIKGIQMLQHAGMDSYGMVSISEYMTRIRYAYKMFFRPDRGFYPSFISKVYKLLLLCCVIMVAKLLYRSVRANVGAAIRLLLVTVLIPFAICFIYVLAGDAYSLVLYPYTLVYLFFIWLLDNGMQNETIYKTWMQRCGIILVVGMCCWFCRYSNVTYMKAELLQSRAISYYTTMITRMQSIEGYSEEMPVAYVNAHQSLSLKTVTITPDFQGIPQVPDTFLHDYSWEYFVQEWCGFSPEKVDSATLSELEKSEAIKAMPSYPNDGSIQIIDDVLVIKLADE